MEPAVYLVTGPMAAGKSTVARLLAARFGRGVHLEGDLFRRAIVAGRVEPTPDASVEALEQLRLRYRLAVQAVDGYVTAGYTVAYEDVVAGPLLDEVVGLLSHRRLHVVVLLPSVAALAARERERPQRGYGPWTVEALHAEFATGTPRVGFWLDSSELTPDETVDAILSEAEILS